MSLAVAVFVGMFLALFFSVMAAGELLKPPHYDEDVQMRGQSPKAIVMYRRNVCVLAVVTLSLVILMVQILAHHEFFAELQIGSDDFDTKFTYVILGAKFIFLVGAVEFANQLRLINKDEEKEAQDAAS